MQVAEQRTVGRAELLEFVRPRRHVVLMTHRRDGRLQASPVTGTLGDDGRLLVSTYPARAKAANLRREARCSVVVLSDDFDGPWVQLDGTAEVVDGDDGVDLLVDYYRAAAGEHPDWDEYREAMRARGKVAIAVTIEDWGPIATGGVPPEFVDA
jgi:PPOX class probable F420-dependent enzyme